MWRFSILVLAAVAALGIARSQAADDPIVKSVEVQYVGARLVSPQEIKRQITTRVGRPLSVLQADQDVKRLYRSGKITNVRFLQQKASGGVAVIVIVECRANYGGVQFQGNTVLPDRRLNRLVELTENKPVDELSLRKSRQEILALYRRKGYPDVGVDYSIGKPNSNGAALVTFSIHEKSPGILRNVRFEGISALSGTQLKEAMTQKERGLQNVIGGGGRTDALSISGDVKKIEGLYRDHGYFHAKVTRVAKVPVDARHDDLVFHIDEGKNYQVSNVKIDGIKALSVENDINPHLKTQSGKAYSAEDLQDDIDMIIKQYQAKGYMDVKVTPVFVDP